MKTIVVCLALLTGIVVPLFANPFVGSWTDDRTGIHANVTDSYVVLFQSIDGIWVSKSYCYACTSHELIIDGQVFVYNLTDNDHIGLLSWVGEKPFLLQMTRNKETENLPVNKPPVGWQE